MTTTHHYAHPRYMARKTVFIGSAVTLNATADTERARFQFMSDVYVEGIEVRVNTAGTTAGGAFTVKKGTGSIGVVGTITHTANQISTATLASSLATTDSLVISNVSSDATGKFDIWVHYREAYG